jgi:signal peptidase I
MWQGHHYAKQLRQPAHQVMIEFEPALEEAHAVKCDLATEVLRSSGSLRLRVTGLSMLPTVWPGDTLIIQRTSADAVSAGEIVLYGRDRRFFVHRVVKAALDGDSTLVTRGDAMPQADFPVSAQDLLGKVAFIVRDGRLVEPGRNLNIRQKAIAALAQKSEIAARVVVGVHGKLQAASRQNSRKRAVPCQS